MEIILGNPIFGGGGPTTLSENPDALTTWPDAPSDCAGATYLTTINDVSIGEPSQG